MTFQDKVVWEDGERRLFFDGDVLKLRYKGEDYTFSSHGYEPMAIILKDGTDVAYIHNSFIVETKSKVSTWSLTAFLISVLPPSYIHDTEVKYEEASASPYFSKYLPRRAVYSFKS